MGKFDFNFDDELTRQLERLGNFDEIASEMLTKAGDILERHVKANIRRYWKSGDMYNSIKKTEVRYNDRGHYITVRPTGKDENGIRNMEKLAYLEYGTSREPARPVLTKAIKDAEPEITKVMQEIFDREVSK